MDKSRLREQARRLVFAAPRLSEALLSGNFRSIFKGRGMDFEALREYGIDDDALRIDWNASARFGKPYVKTYREDRDLNLFIILDESASMDFGSGRSKHESAVLAASLLAYAASLEGLRVGLLCFGAAEKMEVMAPAAGEEHARVLLERLAAEKQAAAKAESPGSALDSALNMAYILLKRRSLVVIASDFMSSSWAEAIARLARRHDVMAMLVKDKLDSEAPQLGFSIHCADSESGISRFIVPRSMAYKRDRAHWYKNRHLERLVAFKAAKIPFLELDSQSDPLDKLIAFFSRRRLAR
ncbi:DUF58 domain-containing protein [Spirochaetota bacterium]